MKTKLKLKLFKTSLLVCAVLAGASAPLHAATPVSGGPSAIELEELTAAKRAWCDALLLISRTHREGGDAAAVAGQVIDGAYNYGQAPVLFKPTLTFGEQTFRTTREGALAYFVGGNTAFPDDSGFALKPWVSADFVIAASYIEGPLGITMGHVTLTDAQGARTTVEKTFVFRRGDDGVFRIVLHKSALPFKPASA